MSRRLRVVQWTTGKTGSAAVRGMAGHPVLDLVGCYAFSADKVGRDVGELCGIVALGITATDDVEALLALQPDCVSYMAYRPNFDHLERILESGANVVTTMYMMAGIGYGEVADPPAARCLPARRLVALQPGIYPGHAPMVALAASAMCSRIDRFSVLESLDIVGYANEQMFRAQGFDLEPDDPAAYQACESACGSFKEQIRAGQGARIGYRPRWASGPSSATPNQDTRLRLHDCRQEGRIAGFKGTISGEQERPLADRVQLRLEARAKT